MELVICIVVTAFITFLVRAIINYITKENIYRARLEMLEEPRENITKSPTRLIDSSQKMVRAVARVFAAHSYTDNIQVQLIRAGIPLRGEEYITIWLGIVILLPSFTYLLSYNIWLSVIALFLGAFLPRIYLNYKTETRLQTLNQQLADALIVMANALRAGFGFQQAMDTVRTELPPPIATEFAWTLREMNLGFGQEEALLNLSNRVKSEDLDMVITGIIIQRQVGGNLAKILENIASTMRDRARIKKEVGILTAQGRLSGIIIGVLPLALAAIMLTLNPRYFQVMLQDMRGITMLVAAGVMEVVGFLVIKKLINIDL